jgi:hypothetical protein
MSDDYERKVRKCAFALYDVLGQYCPHVGLDALLFSLGTHIMTHPEPHELIEDVIESLRQDMAQQLPPPPEKLN